MFDNYAVLYIQKKKRPNYKEKKHEITYLYGLKSAVKPSGNSKITLICVPCVISPRIEKELTCKNKQFNLSYLLQEFHLFVNDLKDV